MCKSPLSGESVSELLYAYTVNSNTTFKINETEKHNVD